MIANGMTVSDAAHLWVDRMDAIQTGMIHKLMDLDPDDWEEVTEPSDGDRVYVYEHYSGGEILAYWEGEYIIRLDVEGELVACSEDDFEIVHYTLLPEWNTMWSFHDQLDIEWIEDGGVKILSRCGFRVFYSQEFGYFFGIDGGGYDFFAEHWIPLYKKRGMKWHDPGPEGGRE